MAFEIGINKLGGYPYNSNGGGSASFGGFKPTTPKIQPKIQTLEHAGGIGAEGVSSPYINNKNLVSSIGKINGEISPNISGGDLGNRLDLLA